MKTIKRVVLKTATQLSETEMKQVFGGSGTNSGACKHEGTGCTLMIPNHKGVYLPYTGRCTTETSGAWRRCACVVSQYSSDPSKPSHACQSR